MNGFLTVSSLRMDFEFLCLRRPPGGRSNVTAYRRLRCKNTVVGSRRTSHHGLREISQLAADRIIDDDSQSEQTS
jgi:hypothetical protein